MEEPNKKISECTVAEIKTFLGACFSMCYGIDLEDADKLQEAAILYRECVKYHGKLFVWKLREIFGYHAAGDLDEFLRIEPEVNSYFIYKLKKTYFDNLKAINEKDRNRRLQMQS